MDDHTTETRNVEAHDPGLSDKANQRLTEEMREVVGSDTVEVPAGTPDHRTDRHTRHSPTHAALANTRWELIVTLFVIAVSVGVAAVATGSVVFLVGLLLLLVVGLGLTVRTILAMTSEREHADPRTAALLEEEGIDDPDAVLSDLVDGLEGARSGDRTDRT